MPIQNKNLIVSSFSRCPALNKTEICRAAGIDARHLSDLLRGKGNLQPTEADSLTRQLVQIKNLIVRCFVAYDPAKLLELICDRRIKYNLISPANRGTIEYYRNNPMAANPPLSLFTAIKSDYMVILPLILN